MEERTMGTLVRLGLFLGVSSARVLSAAGGSGGRPATERQGDRDPAGPEKGPRQFLVSPTADTWPSLSMHGSREVVVVDGVDGPEFDHAGKASNSLSLEVTFSQDGSHSAYIAQRGDALIAMIDGKEAYTVVPSMKTGMVPESTSISPARARARTSSSSARAGRKSRSRCMTTRESTACWWMA
jgi:hypothetical protein